MQQDQPTLLIVDKSAFARKWFPRHLKGEFQFLTAKSCHEALKILKERGQEIDLMLIDDDFSQMQRFTLCKKIHRSRKNGHMAILVMTEKESLDYFHRALRSGVADLLHKPLISFNVRKSIYLALQFQYKLMTMGMQLSDFKNMAHRDALTRLYNRRYLTEQGEKEICKVRRTRQPLCALMLDIDHFKRINSLFGHLVADDILVQFARLLTANLRAYDSIVRYGGEEFVVILPHTNLKQASLVAEKLRSYIAGYPFFNGKSYFHLTCSIGISQLSRQQTLQQLLAQSDTAMMDAKRKGRNCIVTYRKSKKS